MSLDEEIPVVNRSEETGIEQLDVEFLERIFAGELYEEHKFIIAEGPDGRGYIRFTSVGRGHDDERFYFLGEVAKAGFNDDDFPNKGGGTVLKIDYDPDKINDLGREGARVDNPSLFFCRSSDTLGIPDYSEDGLLARTLRELVPDNIKYIVG